MNPLTPSLSVIVCATAKQTWDSLSATVNSVQRQSLPATEILIVVDHNPLLFDRATAFYPHLKVIPNTDVRGRAGARHTGLEAARGRIIAFLEGDEVARPNWLTDLISVYKVPHNTETGRAVFKESIPQRKVS